MNLLDANTIDKDCKLKTKILIVGRNKADCKILSENDYEFTILKKVIIMKTKKKI